MLNLTTEKWVSLNFPYKRKIDKYCHATFVCIKVAFVLSNGSANKRYVVVWILLDHTYWYLFVQYATFSQ
jgi:hypothetical protein